MTKMECKMGTELAFGLAVKASAAVAQAGFVSQGNEL